MRKVYKVEKTDKTPSDWADTVDDNRKKYQINLTDEQIEATSNYKFENIVKHLARPGLGSALARLHCTMLSYF